jgi:hypothetical protein
MTLQIIGGTRICQTAIKCHCFCPIHNGKFNDRSMLVTQMCLALPLLK